MSTKRLLLHFKIHFYPFMCVCFFTSLQYSVFHKRFFLPFILVPRCQYKAKNPCLEETKKVPNDITISQEITADTNTNWLFSLFFYCLQSLFLSLQGFPTTTLLFRYNKQKNATWLPPCKVHHTEKWLAFFQFLPLVEDLVQKLMATFASFSVIWIWYLTDLTFYISTYILASEYRETEISSIQIQVFLYILHASCFFCQNAGLIQTINLL